MASDLKGGTDSAEWSAEGTSPEAIAAALRELLGRLHAEHEGLVPARALNMIVFTDSDATEATIERLQGSGRYHASRLIVLSYDARRRRMDARAEIASDGERELGELALLHETVTVEVGERHLVDLATIVDPLVVSDLPTLLWSPGDHPGAVDALLSLTQTLLLDSIDEPVCAEAISRAAQLAREVYVVDLAWLRTAPWRERIAMIFDPADLRGELERISAVEIRHHPDSVVAGFLLFGWLSSRLDWESKPLKAGGKGHEGEAKSGERSIALHLHPAPKQKVPGLQGITLRTEGGHELSLDRGAGGLRACMQDPDGEERRWTVLGASRGEPGILGDGIRQALMRDPTYVPALRAARAMCQ